MAKIVLGMATSHGPMLSTPAEQWGERVVADKRSSELYFRGKPYNFDDLARARAGENLGREIALDKWRERHAACTRALKQLSSVYGAAAPDIAVIIGDDQKETFLDDNMPAFSVYWGETMDNVPLTAEQSAKLPPGIAVSHWGHCPAQKTTYPGEAKLGLHLIESLMAEEFDVAHSTLMPPGRFANRSTPHAYGFIYRRIMNDNVIPNVPVFINTFYPPNQPSLKRCYNFGKAIGRAIASWKSDKTVAVFASGGLSHFVIEQDLDDQVLDAMRQNNEPALLNLPQERFQSGTSEIRNWLALAGVLADRNLSMQLVDYVPCYRSEAGTGNAMGFAYWK